QSALWDNTARPAFRFFYYQRCGFDVPGYHAVCHLDDAVGASGKQYVVWGGWHDAGDYNTYTNAPYAFGLFQVYRTQQARWDALDMDANGRSDLVDEILWGADHTRRMVLDDGSTCGEITSGYEFWGPPELETDNVPGTGDERPVRGAESGNDPGFALATAAAAARCPNVDPAYLDAALRAYAWRAQRNVRDALQLSAALDLYAATGNATFADDARAIVRDAPPDDAEVLRRYDAAFGTDHGAAVRERAVARTEAMLDAADNPFGVYTYGTKDQPNFFATPHDRGGWHVGNSSHVLDAAAAAAEAFRYTRDPRYLAFVYDQLNWVLGNNPYGLCLMEGVGSVNPPSYHHRYGGGGVPRGAVPGSVVNGITWRAPGDDRPYFDLRGIDVPDFESNEVWLPHNVNYLKAIAGLYAAREAERAKRPQ
ncbi:MAG: hypothetical protein FJY92_06340, partial [Candidatus Hydrogenedentes bacterium]|nr:hypothetical protein [Candidatus Hydrogenedentota bacterium]